LEFGQWAIDAMLHARIKSAHDAAQAKRQRIGELESPDALRVS
jgi:hypothetical protein